MDTMPLNENPAIALLTEQCDRYSSTMKRLEAQQKGVEAKLAETNAKFEATKEALDALLAQVGRKAVMS